MFSTTLLVSASSLSSGVEIGKTIPNNKLAPFTLDTTARNWQ